MAGKVASVGYAIALAAMVLLLLLAIHTKAAENGPYHFSKIVYRWHRTYCDLPRNKCRGRIIKNLFPIHGRWTNYFPDKPVPELNDSGCTTVRPANLNMVSTDYLAPILNKMYVHWPDLDNTEIRSNCVNLWRSQWLKHGRCFDHPDNPFYYFNTTVDFVDKHNMLQILEKGGIEPDDMSGYSGSEFTRVITDPLEFQVEIACFKIKQRLLLYEVRVCFAPDGSRMACPTPFKGCRESDAIWYLPAYHSYA